MHDRFFLYEIINITVTETGRERSVKENKGSNGRGRRAFSAPPIRGYNLLIIIRKKKRETNYTGETLPLAIR